MGSTGAESSKFCEMQVYLSDVLTFAVEHGRVRRCDSRPVAASLHRVRGRRPARRAGLRPLHHRHRWDLVVGRGACDGEYLLDTTCPLLLQTSVKLYGIGGHVMLLLTFVFECRARSGSLASASAQNISASFRYWRLCRSDFATT